MTDIVIAALLAALPPTLLSLSTLMQSLKNSKKADLITVKTDEIHSLANGNLSKLTTKADMLQAEVGALRELVTALTSKQGVPGPAGPVGETGEAGEVGLTGRKGDRGSPGL